MVGNKADRVTILFRLPLPNNKTLAQSKLKTFLNFDKMAKFVFDRVEDIAGKNEKPGYQNFLVFVTNSIESLSLGRLMSYLGGR